MTRYVVIGAGAVGGTLAAEWTRVGVEVVAVARGEHLRALRADPLRYVTPEQTYEVPVATVGGAQEITLRPDDVLVLATKAQDAEAALSEWAWQVVPELGASAARVLPVVLLQNGLDTSRSALRRFTTVLDAVVLIPSIHVRPGEVVSPAAPQVGGLYIGAVGSPAGAAPTVGGDTLNQIAEDFRRALFAVQVVTDIARWKAAKLIGNIGYNIDGLFAPSPLRDAASAALQNEAERVLRAAGIDPVDLAADSELDLSGWKVHDIEGHGRGSSTWQSRQRSASLETDYLYGEIALLARLHGVAAPLSTAVQERFARSTGGSQTLGDTELAETLPGVTAPVSPARNVLIDVKTLHDDLVSADPPVLLDVRWALGDPHGHDHYRAGHIPGAVYVDLDTELASGATTQEGRHPLPAIADLQAAARRWGVSSGRPVVVYDANGGLSAARAWWLLRWAGVPDVRILDGAYPAWSTAGLPVETGDVGAEPGDIDLTPGHLRVLTADEAASLAENGILLDARAGERYRGEVEPIDPRAGHIPGAISAPTGGNIDGELHFLPPDRLRERFTDLGVAAATDVGVYCGSGVTAAHEIAALAVAGIDAGLYAGSWSAWSSDPYRPVATTPEDPPGPTAHPAQPTTTRIGD